MAEWIWSNYSEYAIENLCEQFIREKEKVYGILNGHQADKKGCEPDDMGKIW